MGTFRTYTWKVEGSGINTFKNWIIIENNVLQLGHRRWLYIRRCNSKKLINRRILGNHGTLFIPGYLFAKDCYIDGTD